MILLIRQRHRRIFMVLGVVLPVAFIAGIAARRTVPTDVLPAELRGTAQNFTATNWTRSDLFAKVPVQVRLLRERAGASRFAIAFSAAKDFVKPDLIVYWVAGNPTIHETLPDNALLLGTFSAAALPLPEEATKTIGVLILYSLADSEIVDVSQPLASMQEPGGRVSRVPNFSESNLRGKRNMGTRGARPSEIIDMGVEYIAVQWNRQKRFYDAVLLGGVAVYLVLFGVVTEKLFPLVTDEIMLMRAFGTAAFVLLHIILCTGPLCRLNPKFLPLLYNRRHAGVTMFVLALIHAVLVITTYHAGSDVNPLLSIFVSSPINGSVEGVPFQPFGFFALVILFLMAATSHDFWLANLTAPVWKSLHMMVYVAYALLVLHVTFGILQGEGSPVYVVAVALGLMIVLGLHLAAARREAALDKDPRNTEHATHSKGSPSLVTSAATDEFIEACAVADVPENRARIVCLSGERVAIFRYDGKISAVSNVCQHQNGPLGEGKIIYGCITCPWHGYQYQPDTGASPPPFTEKVPTFNVRVQDGRVFVHPKPNPAGTRAEPAKI